MRLHLLILFLFLLAIRPLSAFAQEPEKKVPGEEPKEGDNEKRSFTDRVFTGGDLGLQFGTVTLVNLSPLVGYMLTDELAIGTGITYQYYSNRNYNFSTSIYGGSLFTRYYFDDNLFGHGEYEMLNVEAFDGLHERVNVTSFLVGAGYNQPLGERSAITLLVLWNFTPSYYWPYSNPVIRGGINFGF